MEAALLVILLRRARRRRRRDCRTMWMHPLTCSRLSTGQYYTIMPILRADPLKFENYFRMSQDSFDELLGVLKVHIEKKDTSLSTT